MRRLLVAGERERVLGDGEGDHCHLDLRDQGRKCGQVCPVVGSDEGGDHLVAVALGTALDERVEAVLGGQDLGGLGTAAGECGDAPAVAGALGVPGLVGAVECAQPEVDDPRRGASTRVVGVGV